MVLDSFTFHSNDYDTLTSVYFMFWSKSGHEIHFQIYKVGLNVVQA